MGTKAREIVGKDVIKTISLLNKAFADEWLAYYQYWIGAKIAHGLMRTEIVNELEEHADEELKHAEMLTARIIQLGGTPILEPSKWYKETNCGFQIPENPSIKSILKQNIQSEQCAIEVYKKLAEATQEKDAITYHLALEILKDEIKHEDELEAFLKDMSI